MPERTAYLTRNILYLIALFQMVCLNVLMMFAPVTNGTIRSAPVSLDDLARRITALWTSEPCVGEIERDELLGELHDLETDVDRLILRRDAGVAIHAAPVRSCLSRYLWLRESWSDEERAA